MNKAFKIFLFFILFSGLAGCGGSRQNDEVTVTEDLLSTALAESINNQVIPAALNFQNKAVMLQSSSSQFCQSINTENLDKLQQRWRELSEQWYRLSIYHFGPVNDDIVFPRYTFIDSLRLRGTNYIGSIRENISGWLLNDVELNENYFNSLTFQKVGLLALESLLFETASGEHSTENANILSEYSQTARKCDVLKGVSSHLVKQAEYIYQGWTLDFKSTGVPFKTKFLNAQLDDGTAPISAMIIAIQSQLDYLPKRHVVTTAAQISKNSWENISSTMNEVEAWFQGSDSTTLSFAKLMTNAGFENSVAIVKQNISTIRQAISDREVALLETELGRLDGNFKREIPEALKVQLGINFTDGD